jgi:Xaa-Pro aminopeptidase
MKNACLLFLLFLAPTCLFAQNAADYDTDQLPPSFFAANREKFLRQIGDSSIAVFFAAEVKNRTNDVDYLYRQDNSLYYLSGLEEPESMLLVSTMPMTVDGKSVNEILFVNRRDSASEVWTGRRLGTDGAMKTLGVQLALTNDRFDSVIATNLPRFKSLYLTKAPSTSRKSKKVESAKSEAVEALAKEKNLTLKNSLPLLAKMRMIKSPDELRVMQQAIDASLAAHRQAMMSCEVGMKEYDLAAIVEYVFKRYGCEYTAYPSIVGAAENSVILHYETVRRKLNDGDLIVMDVAGEYHNYTADITRTFPVNGHFTKEQKEIYDLVLMAQDSAIAQVKAGADMRDPHRKAVEIISKGLVALGLIKDEKDYRKYFMHGTSHYVGLDVHDAGDYQSMQAGEVLTVEPGIYIAAGSDCDKKYWNIGVRIEDDILVTDTGYKFLSEKLPRKTKAIEDLMKKQGIGNFSMDYDGTTPAKKKK